MSEGTADRHRQARGGGSDGGAEPKTAVEHTEGEGCGVILHFICPITLLLLDESETVTHGVRVGLGAGLLVEPGSLSLLPEWKASC